MKTYTLFISALAAMLAVSCSKGEQGPDTPAPVGSEYIKVSATIASSATAKGIVKDPAALTGISFLHAEVASEPAAGTPVSFAGKVAFAGDKAATGGAITFAAGSEPKYDKTPTKLISYLIGYHPAGTPGTDKVSWTPDGATDILVTDLWKAGTYLAPVTGGMEFGHALARIEVKTKFAPSTPAAAVAETWGQLKGIAFKDAPKTITFDYATNAVTSATAAADLANFSLLNGGAYAAGAFTTVAITATADVVAAAMIPPTGVAAFTLIVSTEKQPDVEIPVTLDAGTFVAGQIHVVTLAFDAKDKTIKATSTAITDWNTGTHGEEGVEPPPPAIGDYYYSDNTSSATFDAGKTLLGVIYRLNPDGKTGMLVEVTEAPTGTKWSTVTVPTGAASEDSGVANTNAIKVLDPTLANYPAFKHCEDKNTGGVTGWYLPANKEMRALYAGYSGLRWMDSGATAANGEINDWGNNTAMPGDTYTAARTAFNAKMTNPIVGGTNLASYYWSATESNTSNAWFVNFSNGFTNSLNYKANANSKARCVREF